jgi:hypothetical protein
MRFKFAVITKKVFYEWRFSVSDIPEAGDSLAIMRKMFRRHYNFLDKQSDKNCYTT